MRLFVGLIVLLVIPCIYVAAAENTGQGSNHEYAQGTWPNKRLLSTKTSVEPGTYGIKYGNEYGYLVEHMALSDADYAKYVKKVVKGHPRLFMRPKAWKVGLSLAEFRERAKQEPYKKIIHRSNRPKHAAACALYYLATGDESVIPALVDKVMAAKPAFKCGGGSLGPCLVYDRIINSPSLTDEQKTKMRDHLVKVAFKCAEAQQSPTAFAIFHHRGGAGWIRDVLVTGLTLYGEHPEAEKLIRWGMGYFLKNYCRGWERLGGRWGGYWGAARTMPTTLACWGSAVESPDIHEIVKNDFGDWEQGILYFHMAASLPGNCFSGAVAGWSDHDHSGILSTAYMAISRAHENPDGYAFLRSVGRKPEQDVLFYDKKIDEKKSWFEQNRPFTWIWGRDGNGYVQMRSKGWAKDTAVVEFKCGDYFWSHALNCNNNSFYIYHKGHLAPQSGIYDSYYRGAHDDYYYPRTVAANCMLIVQPGEWWAPKKPKPAYGGQRIPYRFGSSNFTFDEYLSRLKELRFEMGSIPAFEHAPDYSWSYVCGDATDSYNNPKYSDVPTRGGKANTPKIDLFTRSLVYLPESNNLIVFDRVNALDPSYRKAWLIHSVGKPKVSGKIIKTEVAGHIEDFDGDTAELNWEGGVFPPPDPKDPGRLFVKTFLPKKHYMRRIGGKDHEFWVLGKNRPVRHYTGSVKPGTGKGVEVGNWRLEISPTDPATFDNFLHLIHICDSRTASMPAAQMVESKGHKMVGLSAGKWVVMFGRKGEVQGEVSYRTPDGKTEHLVVDLKRGGRYKVSGITGGDREMTASKEGVLQFATDKKILVRIRVLD